MNFNTLTKIETDNLSLRKISDNDRSFIDSLFKHEDIRKYYIVPKEAQQDYKRLVSYWLHDMAKGAGFAWVIYKKSNSFFSSDKPCGFIAFEFRDSLKNARISYALKPDFRKQGIITKSIKTVIEELEKLGVETVEADIDKDNTNSEKIVTKLGFSADKRGALVDFEMMRDGDIRLRHLWRKELYDYSSLPFHVIKEMNFHKMITDDTIFKVWEEEVVEGGAFGMYSPFTRKTPTGKYHFLIQTDVTESLVGLSDDSRSVYNVPWELLREQKVGKKNFMIFCGWGDEMNGGNKQFDYYEIGVEKSLLASLIQSLMQGNPDFFSFDKMSNVIGLENMKLQR